MKKDLAFLSLRLFWNLLQILWQLGNMSDNFTRVRPSIDKRISHSKRQMSVFLVNHLNLSDEAADMLFAYDIDE